MRQLTAEARRLLAALLLLVSVPCSAKVLVVYKPITNELFDPGDAQASNIVEMRSQVVGMLNAFGVDYDLIPSNIAMTEYCRTGVMVFNKGDANAYTRTYDAVIHLMSQNALTPQSAPVVYRADSLFSTSKAPVVPQLFYTWSYGWVASSASCAGCSLGVYRASGGYNSGNWQDNTLYDGSGTLRMRSTRLDGYALTYLYPGIVRGMLFQKFNTSHAQEVLPTAGAPCMDCDSLLAGGAPGDTVSMYKITNTNYTVSNGAPANAKPIIVCVFGHNHADQSDPSIAIMGLAALDSLTGGTIIKKPLKLGLYLAGGFRRSGRTTWGGISPDDTTAYKASLDSLATLKVPITVGVNLASDTLSTNIADFGWYRKLGSFVSYAPENWQALSDSTKGKGNASLTQPIDPWGRFRKRAQYGDSLFHYVNGSDTSVYTLLVASYATMISNSLTPIDRGVAPPFFDNVSQSGSGAGDSMFYGAYKAGARAVLVDVSSASSYGAQNNPATTYTRSQYASVGSVTGGKIKVLGAITMPQDSSAARWANGMSTDTYSFLKQWGVAVESFWCSVVDGRGPEKMYTASPGRSIGNPFAYGRARVFVVSASDFGSGTRSDWATRPTRPGWWAVKSIVNAARIANSFALAGKPVISFVRLEDVEP